MTKKKLTAKQEMAPRKPFDRHLREAIIHVYKGKCQYCGCEGANHIDHIVPRSKGGSDDDLSNLILACQSCNLRKGAGEMAETFLALMSSIADRHKERIERKAKEFKSGVSKKRDVQYYTSGNGVVYEVDMNKLESMDEVRLFADLIKKLIREKQGEDFYRKVYGEEDD